MTDEHPPADDTVYGITAFAADHDAEEVDDLRVIKTSPDGSSEILTLDDQNRIDPPEAPRRDAAAAGVVFTIPQVDGVHPLVKIAYYDPEANEWWVRDADRVPQGELTYQDRQA